jgi:hypothetical protein
LNSLLVLAIDDLYKVFFSLQLRKLIYLPITPNELRQIFHSPISDLSVTGYYRLDFGLFMLFKVNFLAFLTQRKRAFS